MSKDFWEGYVPEPVTCPVCKAKDSPYPKCGCVRYIEEPPVAPATKDEALKLALEALDAYSWEQVNAAITALRTAIEQAEKQEPVAWMDEFGNVFPLGAQRGPKYLNEPMKPLYTTPTAAQRQWVGLTGDEREQIYQEHYPDALATAIAAVEAKLKEKNK